MFVSNPALDQTLFHEWGFVVPSVHAPCSAAGGAAGRCSCAEPDVLHEALAFTSPPPHLWGFAAASPGNIASIPGEQQKWGNSPYFLLLLLLPVPWTRAGAEDQGSPHALAYGGST